MERYDLWPKRIRDQIERAYYDEKMPYWMVAILLGRQSAGGLRVFKERQERVKQWFDGFEGD